ncbi:TetR/AcrR family transcriptional regulator [Nocardia sp. NPDC056611]|uniref:TetR/AcrR family transcriptional regulator n=1 Tax=Nocardia sp. NPDC056611 TaxID=3345877 RepID=UPI00366B57CA
MPRIDAPTVAEHRANQEQVLLRAARELLLNKGVGAVTPAAVGAAAGLARSSVYKYFRSGEEILARIVADSFDEWAEAVRAAMDRVDGADARIATYVRASLEAARAGTHRVAVLGGNGLTDSVAREQISRAHRELSEPLRQALAARGDAEPELMAELVDGALGRAIDRIDAGDGFDRVLDGTARFIGRALEIANLEE